MWGGFGGLAEDRVFLFIYSLKVEEIKVGLLRMVFTGRIGLGVFGLVVRGRGCGL